MQGNKLNTGALLVALAALVVSGHIQAADNYWQCMLDHRKSINGASPLQAADSLCKKQYPIRTEDVVLCDQDEELSRESPFNGSYLTFDKPAKVCTKTIVIYPAPNRKWPWSPQSIDECILRYSEDVDNRYGLYAVREACKVLYREVDPD